VGKNGPSALGPWEATLRPFLLPGQLRKAAPSQYFLIPLVPEFVGRYLYSPMMPALTRRRESDRQQECWHIDCGNTPIGTITEHAGC
jgi:hypothetical protein